MPGGHTDGSGPPAVARPYAGFVDLAVFVLVAVTCCCLALMVIAIAMSRRARAEAPGRPAVVAEYAPPESMDAASAALILQRPRRVLPAKVLELAVRGAVRFVPSTRRRRRLDLTPGHPKGLDSVDAQLVRAMFPPGTDTFRPSRRNRGWSSAAQQVLAHTRAAAIRWQRRLDGANTVIILGMLAFLAELVLVLVAGLAGAPLGLVMSLGFVGVIAAILPGPILGREFFTPEGAEARDHLLGLKEFMHWAEEDRIRALQSPETADMVGIDEGATLRLYERLLPYAAVFGMTKEWLRVLRARYADEGVMPVWLDPAIGDLGTADIEVVDMVDSVVGDTSISGDGDGGGDGGGD